MQNALGGIRKIGEFDCVGAQERILRTTIQRKWSGKARSFRQHAVLQAEDCLTLGPFRFPVSGGTIETTAISLCSNGMPSYFNVISSR